MNYSGVNVMYQLGNETLGQPLLEVVLAAGNDTGLQQDEAAHQEGDAAYGSPPLLKQTTPMVIVFTIAYGVVLLLAVINNSIVVTAIHRNQNLRTITNMFVANLAIADITVSLLVLPITLLSNLFTEWHYGEFLCRAIPYLQAVAVGASVNTLAAVAVERYLAIFYSGTLALRPNQAGVVIAVIWLIPACIQIPWAVHYRLNDFLIDEENNIVATYCYPSFPTKTFFQGFFLGVVFLTCYLIPLCFLAVFYSLIGMKVWRRSVAGIAGSQTEKNINRSKIRIVRMLIAVTTVFALSWLPLYCINIISLFYGPLEGQKKALVENTLMPIAQWLGSANSCANPFIYCYFSEHFRKAIFAIFKDMNCCRRLGPDQGSPITMSTKVIINTHTEKKDPNDHKECSIVMTGTNGKVHV